MNDPVPAVSAAEFAQLYDAVSNWGRWGAKDERGTLNHLTPSEVTASAALVREGRVISLAHDLDSGPGPDNTKPALHFMTQRGDIDMLEPRVNTDFVGLDYHGKSVTHLDALCHCIYRGLLYNGVDPTQCVTSSGSSFGSVRTTSAGVVGRGVLLDAAHSFGVEWLEPGTALTDADLERICENEGIELRRGDVVMIRTGTRRRREMLGPWNPHTYSAGLHPTAIRFLHEHDVAVLGSDGDSDSRPSPVEGVESPIHALALSAMGMPLIDNLNLEDLSRACTVLRRWEFYCALAPLRIPGGTGSPLNPIAVL